MGRVYDKCYWDLMQGFITNKLNLKNTYLGTRKNTNLIGFSNKSEVCGNWEWEKTI